MKTLNHIAGGILFSGTLASLQGINLFASLDNLSICLIASMLPDIDYPKSIPGRIVSPFSNYLLRKYGHRTITHSLIALVGSTLLLYGVEFCLQASHQLSLFFFYGYLSHLLLDMMTLSGVPLCYPFSRMLFVLPANPNFRFNTNNNRMQLLLFCFLLSLCFYFHPLFKNGFWTSYNRFFGTLKHLVAEYERNTQLLEVTYEIRQGSTIQKGSGFCIKADRQNALLWSSNKFITIDPKQYVIEQLIPKVSPYRFTFQKEDFFQIPLDSINQILTQNTAPIVAVHLQSNTPIRFIKNGISTVQSSLKAEGVESLQLQAIVNLKETYMDTFSYRHNIRIPLLKEKLRHLLEQQEEEQQQQSLRMQQQQTLRNQWDSLVFFPQKEEVFQKYQALQKARPYSNWEEKIRLAQVELSHLEQMEREQHKALYAKAQAHNQQKKNPPIWISGSWTRVLITSIH